VTSEFAIGVHALVYLNHKNETLSSELLAENICTNPARIRKVMAKLKTGGLIVTQEGLKGGYRIGKPAEDITLKSVCEALREDIVKASWKSGNADMECLVASGMAGIMDDLYGDLNALCMDHLATITIADIDRKIFGK